MKREQRTTCKDGIVEVGIISVRIKRDYDFEIYTHKHSSQWLGLRKFILRRGKNELGAIRIEDIDTVHTGWCGVQSRNDRCVQSGILLGRIQLHVYPEAARTGATHQHLYW
jgi:hypothetical protein